MLLVENPRPSSRKPFDGQAKLAKFFLLHGVKQARMQAATRANDNYIKDGGGYGRMEMDTHADTCVLGINFVILEYSGRVCDVYPYSQDYEAIKDIPIVRGATAVQDQDTGETYMLVINEGLWYGNRMHHSLINPNQLFLSN